MRCIGQDGENDIYAIQDLVIADGCSTDEGEESMKAKEQKSKCLKPSGDGDE